MTGRRVLVDADACPVKDEALEIADRFGAQLVLVSNGGLRPSRYPGARLVTVPAGADAADDWIAAESRATDVVVTTDILLAARALEAGAAVLGPEGRPFTAESIGSAISMRAFNQHLRETGESRGLNRAYSPQDRSRFRQALDAILRRPVQASDVPSDP